MPSLKNTARFMTAFVVLAMLFSHINVSKAKAAGPSILLLADTTGAGTPALVSALTTAGYSVTVHAPEYTWNGNPSLAAFQCVIHLDGTTYNTPLSVSAQLALVNYVKNGHCFVATQWDGYERAVGIQTSMNDLILLGWPGSQQFGPTTLTTVAGQAGHPVLAGITSPVVVNGGYLSPGMLYTYAENPSTVLMVSSTGEPAVVVRQFGSGCVVNLAFALNYSGPAGLNDPTIQRLFINSLNWGTSLSCAGNQPPTADAGGSYSGSEGSAIALSGATASGSDPNALTYAWTVDSAACSFDDASALNPNLTCSDNGSFTATLSVSDGVNPAVTSDAAVTVDNVAPAASLGSDGPIDEGGSATVSLTGASDPSSEDTAAGFHYAFDCGGGSLSAATYASSGTSASVSCPFADNGTYTVSGKIMDKDGGSSEYTTSVTVNNVAPAASLGSDGPIDEGGSATVSLSGASDPSSEDTAAGFHYAFDCGGGSLSAATYASSGTSASVSCPFADNGAYTVSGKIMDKDGGSSEYTTSVTVNNVAPAVGLVSVPTAPIDINQQPVTGVSAPFTDPGTVDSHTCTVDYGDGSGPQAGTAAAGVCTGAGHTYTQAGVYVVTVEVVDDDLGAASATATSFIVIYNPSGGFVTGGGWIDSPVNASYQYMHAGGKANFGFVAKYKKGANVPDGNTQFQFKAGDLNFHSSRYEWLVVAGTQAKFKGEGTINGQGNYKFMITADDDNVDTFRIKIWYEDGGEVVVYDNGAQQPLGGGNIKIHK